MIFAVIALVGLIWHIGQNHFRRATATNGNNRARRGTNPSPLLKAELDAEEGGRDELEAKDREYEVGQTERYEIDGVGCSAEMTRFNGEGGKLPSFMERVELRGEEHSAELAGNGIENH